MLGLPLTVRTRQYQRPESRSSACLGSMNPHHPPAAPSEAIPELRTPISILPSVRNSSGDHDQEVRDLDAFFRIDPESPPPPASPQHRTDAEHLAEKGGKNDNSGH